MSAEQEGRRAAQNFRLEHHLGSQPLADLITIIEQEMGHDVAVLDAPADEHGMSIRDPQRGVVFIAVARSRRPMRQRSSLAHELAHVVFGDWADQPITGRSATEVRADAFARHLLVPREGLRDILGTVGNRQVDTSTLSDVVQRFLVSPALAAIALHDGGYIATSTKTQWLGLTTPALASRFGWADLYAVLQDDADKPRAPQQLLRRAIAGYMEGVVSLETVASLRGRPLDQVRQELEAAGVEPAADLVEWSDAGALPDVEVDLSSLDDDAAPGS
ncbi:ImmA/IrrE family metallo-endopeptidase [Ornithinimicrobium sp. LYQ103]|uniref:ImmA/IrrE family metallo-endopeptidase n=1 Tax=Ornithinimicrobium sp. LYQ103 TaxID=3378796 RepID=UPI0038519FFA